MKAVVFNSYGGPEVLEVQEIDRPRLKAGEVLIRVCATTVIAGDCEVRSFKIPFWYWLPFRIYVGFRRPKRIRILGQDLAGVVEAVGSDVVDFKVGDEVFGSPEARFGVHAEYACLGEHKALVIKPEGLTFEQCAVLPTGGLNALHYLRQAKIQKGERVLINGAGGNIGSFAVQIAKYFGGEVTAVDHGEKGAFLRSIGADHVLDYTAKDFTKNNVKYDVVFDVVCRGSFSGIVGVLEKGGRYVMANPTPMRMIRGLGVSWFTRKTVKFSFADYTKEDLRYLCDLVEKGELKPAIDRCYEGLEEVASAHRYVDSKMQEGNVVIRVSC